MDKLLSAHQPVYLPWLGFFHKIIVSDLFPRKAEFFETQTHYFNLAEYRNPNAMYFQYFFIFVFSGYITPTINLVDFNV